MRQPPSPLLLSARKRRPRRNPPRGAQYGAGPAGSGPQSQQHQQQQHEHEHEPVQATSDEQCALLQRDPNDAPRGVSSQDDEPKTSSR
jgi:hypothetical protein